MPRVRGGDEAERQDEGGNPTVDVRHVFADRGHAPTGRGTRQAARRVPRLAARPRLPRSLAGSGRTARFRPVRPPHHPTIRHTRHAPVTARDRCRRHTSPPSHAEAASDDAEERFGAGPATFVAVARRNVVEHVHVESGQFRAEPTFQPFDGLRDCGLGDAGRGDRVGKAAAAMPELRGGAAIAACRHRHARSTVAQVSRIAGTPDRAGDFDVNGSRRVDCFLRTRRTSCVAPRIRPQRLASPCRTLIQSHPHGMAHGPFRGALAPADRRNAAPTAQEHRHARPCAGGPTVMQIGRIGGGNGHAHTVAGD